MQSVMLAQPAQRRLGVCVAAITWRQRCMMLHLHMTNQETALAKLHEVLRKAGCCGDLVCKGDRTLGFMLTLELQVSKVYCHAVSAHCVF